MPAQNDPSTLSHALIVLILIQFGVEGRVDRLNSRLVGHVVDVGRHAQLGVDRASLELLDNIIFVRERARPAKRTARRTSARCSIKVALPSETWSRLHHS